MFLTDKHNATTGCSFEVERRAKRISNSARPGGCFSYCLPNREIWIVNDEQKIRLWLGICVIVLMGIFPPTPRGYCPAVRIPAGIRYPGRPQEIIHYEPPHFGYTFLFTVKTSDIGFGKLVVQWAVVAVVTAGSIYSFRDKKDNKKQKICLWIGIAVIVLMGIFLPVGKRIISSHSRTNRGLVPDYKTIKYAFFFTAKSQEIEYGKLFGQWSIVGAVTGGLIYAFRDKKLKDEQKQ